jgi:hypothetical protein
VQVLCDEEVATHIGPEPCAGVREDVGEASAREWAAQPLSRDRKRSPGADAVCVAEGDMFRPARASGWPSLVEDPGRSASSLYGKQEVWWSAIGPLSQMVRG